MSKGKGYFAIFSIFGTKRCPWEGAMVVVKEDHEGKDCEDDSETLV